MSFRWLSNNRAACALVALLLGMCMAATVCFAGGAATIVLDKKLLAPRGSYIPDRRVEEVLQKVNDHKAMMEKKKSLQLQEPQREDKLLESPSPDKK